MALYLSRFSYTPETWARLIRNPEDRRKAAQLYIESVGGRLHGFWYAFGTHDGYNLWEAPDDVSMAAVALAIGGGGALSSFETTVLLTVEEAAERARSHKALVIGSGAPLVAEAAGSAVETALHAIEPHARFLVQLAADRPPSESVSPLYLRAPDVKPQPEPIARVP